jgi:hypothetical protein
VTVATFCTSGEAERIKGGFHAAAGALVGLMAVYNAVAWWHRRERHLGVNAVMYAAGFAVEVYQTRRHLSRHPEPQRMPAESPRKSAEIARKTAERSRTLAAEPEPCECGDGFCWCGRAESQAVHFAEARY